MQARKRFFITISKITAVLLFFITGCEEEEIITPLNLNLYHSCNITENSARVNVAFWPAFSSTDGEIFFIDAGIVWKEDDTPSLEDNDGMINGAQMSQMITWRGAGLCIPVLAEWKDWM